MRRPGSGLELLGRRLDARGSARPPGSGRGPSRGAVPVGGSRSVCRQTAGPDLVRGAAIRAATRRPAHGQRAAVRRTLGGCTAWSVRCERSSQGGDSTAVVAQWSRERAARAERFPQYPQEPVYACSGELAGVCAGTSPARAMRNRAGSGMCGRVQPFLPRSPIDGRTTDLYTSPPLRAPSRRRVVRVVFYFAPVEILPRR